MGAAEKEPHHHQSTFITDHNLAGEAGSVFKFSHRARLALTYGLLGVIARELSGSGSYGDIDQVPTTSSVSMNVARIL